VVSVTEPTLGATVERRVFGALFCHRAPLMIAAESSNGQQICKRLRGPFTNKFRELRGNRLIENE
jgi:hypothetical protein